MSYSQMPIYTNVPNFDPSGNQGGYVPVIIVNSIDPSVIQNLFKQTQQQSITTDNGYYYYTYSPNQPEEKDLSQRVSDLNETQEQAIENQDDDNFAMEVVAWSLAALAITLFAAGAGMLIAGVVLTSTPLLIAGGCTMGVIMFATLLFSND